MKNRFVVFEACNGFYLSDLVTGYLVCVGDGTDMDFGRTEDHVLTCGMPGFAEAWTEGVNAYAMETLEAYFPRLYSLEIYDNPHFCDRYTVILEEASPLEKSLHCCATLHHSLGLSDDPDGPQGFSQYGYADPKSLATTSEPVFFLDLPENVQRHIAQRLEEDA